YPTLFRLAVDILPAQASSVPSECAFSSAADSDTAKRSRISPTFMEELQLLKYKVRTEALNLTDKWRITEEDL
ncbi:hypothetical protein M422DRAFT_100383, partial [Sphaerobolus stellatus SS14]